MRNRYLLSAGVALAVALNWGSAQAQILSMPSAPGIWYFGGEGGWTSLSNQSGKIAGVVPMRENYGSGWSAGARGGYEWGPWRFEEELRYQHDGATTASIGGFHFGASGYRAALAVMTNAIYDFNVGWPVTPHLGAGVGAVELHDSLSIKSPGLHTAAPTVIGGVTIPPVTIGNIASSTQWEFGYQAIAGIRYNINPSLAFDLDYRYLATPSASFKAAGLGGVKYSSGYSSNTLLASLSIRFGQAPPPVAAPPVPPAPPPVARKVFLVFFDWDKDTITPEGHQILAQAAAAFRAGGPVTIQVTGYTDRSGSPGYNQRLSERRANNVANALVRLGVPRNAMVVSGRGENDNRVPTAPGVREPQNRRVEIVFP